VFLHLKLYTKMPSTVARFIAQKKFGPSWQMASAIVAVDRPMPERSLFPRMKPPGCVRVGALILPVLSSEVLWQGRTAELNPGCLRRQSS
jgi:hypothetical protein